MRCAACGRDVTAFPGASVRCGCGETIDVPAVAGGGPYREAAPMPASFPERPLPGGRRPQRAITSPRCPRCTAPLHAAAGEGDAVAAVLACEGCQGLFVAHSALEETLAAKKGSAAEVPLSDVSEVEVRYLACPRCDERMTRRLFGRGSRLIVDVCSMHGIWFDRGEVERAAELPPEVRPSLPGAPQPPGPPDPETVRRHAELEALMMQEAMADRIRVGPDDVRDLLDVIVRFLVG